MDKHHKAKILTFSPLFLNLVLPSFLFSIIFVVYISPKQTFLHFTILYSENRVVYIALDKRDVWINEPAHDKTYNNTYATSKETS